MNYKNIFTIALIIFLLLALWPALLGLIPFLLIGYFVRTMFLDK